MESNDVIAPFVLKTYQMVNDPSIDNLICWGTANNSFIVVDSLDFSHRLLPAYFKHSNFSSFVRQLNTYGFRKVDPDRWEFANEWFLRGQTHLLKNIGRKRQSNPGSGGGGRTNFTTVNFSNGGDEEDEMLMMEISRLKQEQKDLEQELQGMNRRLEATERWPEQMMTFLYKVAEDPEMLPRMMGEKQKKRRILNAAPSPVKREEDGAASSSPEVNYAGCAQLVYQSSPETPADVAWVSTSRRLPNNFDGISTSNSSGGGAGAFAAELLPFENTSDSGSGGGEMVYFGGVITDPDVRPPPYPFSLLGGGF